jgi:hypothetical protein
MKRVFGVIILLRMMLLSFNATAIENSKEILMRLPLLSAKNAEIITNALDTIKGVKKIEACYELKVLMIAFDNREIENENSLVDLINNLGINTVAEKIYESDIPLIKSKYKITCLYTTKEKSD